MYYTLKVGEKWVCWNSFQAVWYLSDRDHSEVFLRRAFDRKPLPRTQEAHQIFPSARVVWEK